MWRPTERPDERFSVTEECTSGVQSTLGTISSAAPGDRVGGTDAGDGLEIGVTRREGFEAVDLRAT